MATLIPNALFFGSLCAAAWSDIRARRIANELVLGILVAGLVASTLSQGAHGAGAALLGTLVGLALLLPAFAVRWVGGADVKLLAACGAWLGPTGILVGGLLGIALGGVLAVAMAVRGGATREVTANLVTALATRTALSAPRRGRALIVPLAVPLAVGILIVKLGGLA